jgi:hypothetical protein
MTKKEMLAQLKHDRDLCNFNPSTGESEPISEDCRKSAEALDMAIKALEQQSINCNATTEEIAQSFIADVEVVKDYLPKCNSMEFPKTFDEFAKDYGFTDDKEIYTNGSHLIPVFRVNQWIDHIKQQPTSDDCVSRADLIDKLEILDKRYGSDFYWNVRKIVDSLPPVTPTRKSGLRWIERFDNEDKWLECPHCHKDSNNAYAYCPNCGANFKEENRGNEDGKN